MILAEELQRIEDALLPDHRKWGWIIYRTTYGDDAKWSQFITTFQTLVREITLMKDGGSQHVNYIDFPVRQHSGFDKANAKDLRAHFKAWRFSDDTFEEQQLDPSQREILLESERYKYFIRVDAESMQSVLDMVGTTALDGAWVDLIQVDWPEIDSDDEGKQSGKTEEGFPPIEGMTNYEIGFQRVPIDQLYPTCWLDKMTIPEKWYTRPPGLTYRGA
jgi:hypothetical protein